MLREDVSDRVKIYWLQGYYNIKLDACLNWITIQTGALHRPWAGQGLKFCRKNELHQAGLGRAWRPSFGQMQTSQFTMQDDMCPFHTSMLMPASWAVPVHIPGVANYWVSLNSPLANGHSLWRTPSNPLPARKINLKACTHGLWTLNLPANPGIEPGSSSRPFWSSVHRNSSHVSHWSRSQMQAYEMWSICNSYQNNLMSLTYSI